MKPAVLLFGVGLVIVGLVPPESVTARETRMIGYTAASDQPAERVYFYSVSRDESKLLSLHSTLIGRGARSVNCFLPKVVVCELPIGMSAYDFVTDPDISVVFESQVDPQAESTRLFDPGWVRRCYAEASEPGPEFSPSAASLSTPPVPWEESVLAVPEEVVRRTCAASPSDYPDPRNIQQNSELLIGTILANLVFPESTPHPYYRENWTDEAIAKATGEFTLAMLYYQSTYKKAGIHFIVRTVERVITSVEPIDQAYRDNSWIMEVMEKLGYEDDGSGTPHLTAVHEFNNDRREEFGTQWVFTAFIANAQEDEDHLFARARTYGWSYLGGPYLVVSYPAGESLTTQAVKYYLGSIFWALQEGPDVPDDCKSYSGYLNCQNKNKTTRIDPIGGPVGCPAVLRPDRCIMNNTDAFDLWYPGEPCEYTARMLGVSDNNHNSVPDCLDAPPVVYFEHSAVETVFTPKFTLRFKAVSEGVPNQNPRQDPNLLVGYAVPVSYVGRSEGGIITRRFFPVDGVCDELEEDFEFEIESLPAGSSSFAVVTKNAANAMSKEQLKQFFYVGLNFLHFGYENYNEGNIIKFDLLGKTFDASLDLHRVDLEGEIQTDEIIRTLPASAGKTTGPYTLFECLDGDVVPGRSYRYYVQGTFTTTFRDQDTTVTTTTHGIDARAMIPVAEGSIVSRTSPNPFSGNTWVSVVIPPTYEDPHAQIPITVPTDVNVWVYDVLGRRVKRLLSDRMLGRVVLTLQWDGTNERSEKVSAGVYFVKAIAGASESTTKVVVVR